MLGSKNLFSESCLKRPKTRPPLPFWGRLVAIMDFAGVAGGERVLPSPLGWYFFNVFLYLRTQLNSSIHLLLVDFMNTHLSIIHVTKSYTLHSIHDILEIFPIIFVLFKLTHSVQ